MMPAAPNSYARYLKFSLTPVGITMVFRLMNAAVSKLLLNCQVPSTFVLLMTALLK